MHAHAALMTAESLGDEATTATAIAGAVFSDFVNGTPLALDELERAVEIERRVGASTAVSEDRPVATLANVLWRLGEHDRSRELQFELLREAVERGNERDRAPALGGLSDVEREAGNLLSARDHAAELVELGRQQDERSVQMYGLLGGGAVLAMLGLLNEAESLARAGRELALAPVLEPWLAWGDHTLGLVAFDRGEPAAALEHFERSERRSDAAGIQDPACRQLPNGIEALIALGRLDEAADRIGEYEQRCTPERHARVLALIARYRGLVASLRGEHEEAERSFAGVLGAAGPSAERVLPCTHFDGPRNGAPTAPTARRRPACPRRGDRALRIRRGRLSGPIAPAQTSPPSGSDAVRSTS